MVSSAWWGLPVAGSSFWSFFWRKEASRTSTKDCEPVSETSALKTSWQDKTVFRGWHGNPTPFMPRSFTTGFSLVAGNSRTGGLGRWLYSLGATSLQSGRIRCSGTGHLINKRRDKVMHHFRKIFMLATIRSREWILRRFHAMSDTNRTITLGSLSCIGTCAIDAGISTRMWVYWSRNFRDDSILWNWWHGFLLLSHDFSCCHG